MGQPLHQIERHKGHQELQPHGPARGHRLHREEAPLRQPPLRLRQPPEPPRRNRQSDPHKVAVQHKEAKVTQQPRPPETLRRIARHKPLQHHKGHRDNRQPHRIRHHTPRNDLHRSLGLQASFVKLQPTLWRGCHRAQTACANCSRRWTTRRCRRAHHLVSAVCPLALLPRRELLLRRPVHRHPRTLAACSAAELRRLRRRRRDRAAVTIHIAPLRRPIHRRPGLGNCHTAKARRADRRRRLLAQTTDGRGRRAGAALGQMRHAIKGMRRAPPLQQLPARQVHRLVTKVAGVTVAALHLGAPIRRLVKPALRIRLAALRGSNHHGRRRLPEQRLLVHLYRRRAAPAPAPGRHLGAAVAARNQEHQQRAERRSLSEPRHRLVTLHRGRERPAIRLGQPRRSELQQLPLLPRMLHKVRIEPGKHHHKGVKVLR